MTTLAEFKDKQLEILHELDRVCSALGLNYYLAYGSCLGAVRHAGFIPWDDDVDVFLLHDDMKRLIENRRLFGQQYFLQGIETEANFTLMKHNLRDSSTSYFTDEDDCEDINHGMYIDLYTLYPYPDGFLRAHKLILDSYVCKLLLLRRPPLHHGMLGKALYATTKAIWGGHRGERKIRRVMDALENNGGSRYYASFYGDDITPFSCMRFPQELFDEPKKVPFEDYLAPCPTDPDGACRVMFGDGYMEFPPEEERESRHVVRYMSCEEPFTSFKGVYYQEDDNNGV
ncbi:MAG: LicD family protein [Atopobiaceae bacterium]|nr:LicD family protein [Atopobiaceae bacterium]